VAKLPSRLVASVDEPAPGVAGAQFEILWRPSISREGEVGFKADLKGTGVGSSSDEGVWVEELDTGTGIYDLMKFALEGDDSPDASYEWRQPRDPNVNGDGHIGIQWSLLNKSVGSDVPHSIWTQQGDASLRLAALQGAAAPGIADALIGALISGSSNETILYNDLGQTFFFTTLTGTGVDAGSNESIWFETGTGPILMAREGTPAPGHAKVQDYVNGGFGTFGNMVLSPSGTLAFTAEIQVLECPKFDTCPPDPEVAFVRTGLFSNHSGGVNLILHENGPAPGLAGDEVIDSITLVRMNMSDQIAFRGTIRSTSGSILGIGIWISDSSGNPSLVFRTNPSEGPQFGFVSSDTWLLTDTAYVVAVSEDLIPSPLSSEKAIFIIGSSGLSRLASQGQQAPELAADVIFEDFEQVVANTHGQIAFRARVSGPGIDSSNNKGIWVRDADFTIKLVEQTGSMVEVLPGVMRTVSTLTLTAGSGGSDGRPRGFSDNPGVLWLAGTGGINSSIFVTGVSPLPQVQLIGLEVVQSIQDWNNSIFLVENKKTLVRAHLNSSPEVRFEGSLRAFQGSLELDGSPLSMSNSGGYVRIDSTSASKRDTGNASAFFWLPAHWTTGTTRLKLEWSKAEIHCKEVAGPIPNDCKVDATFESVAIPKMRFYSVNWKKDGTTQPVSNPLRWDLAERLIAMYPVKSISVYMREFPWGGTVPPVHGEVNQALHKHLALDECNSAVGCGTIYYGSVLREDVRGGGQADAIGGQVASGNVRSNPLKNGRHTHSHEIGHLLARHHAVHRDLDLDGNDDLNANGLPQGQCGSVADTIAPDFPNWTRFTDGKYYPTIGPFGEGENALIFGVDSDLGRLADPEQLFDVMSYCHFNHDLDYWISDFTYEGIKDAITQRFGTTKSLTSKATVQDYFLVSGKLDFEADSGEFLPFGKLINSTPPDPLPTGDYSIKLKDGGGSTLEEIFFEPMRHRPQGPEPMTGSFMIAVPVDPSVQTVELSHTGSLLASRSASASAPTVTVLSPNGGEDLTADPVVVQWDGVDTDGDPLTYDVQYSPDGGTTWHTLVVDWPGETVDIAHSMLPASSDGKIRVIVSDGFEPSFDESDSPFTVSNNPPIVFIGSPIDGQLFVGDQNITLQATGLDTEDETLDGSTFQWNSDVSGNLGTGNNFGVVASLLAEGDHVITVTVTDSHAQPAQDSVTISVFRDPPGDLADMTMELIDNDDPITAGETLSYSFDVLNNGPEQANNLVFDATFTQETTTFTKVALSTSDLPILDYDAPGWSCAAGTGTINCTRDNLGFLENSTITVDVDSSVPGTVTAAATITADETDPMTGNDSVQETTEILPPEPDIAVSPDPLHLGMMVVGHTVHGTTTVSNSGMADLSIFTVTDPTSIDFDVTVDGCSGQTLAPGNDCSLQISFTPTAAVLHFGEFMIDSNDPDTPTYTVDLVGEGVLPCTASDELTISGQTLSTAETLEACQTLTIGPNVTITNTADVVFRAGTKVILVDPVTVETGASVRLEIDPLLGL
jgi:hypothetical protein